MIFLLSLVIGHLDKAEDNYQENDISVTVKYQAEYYKMEHLSFKSEHVVQIGNLRKEEWPI